MGDWPRGKGGRSRGGYTEKGRLGNDGVAGDTATFKIGASNDRLALRISNSTSFDTRLALPLRRVFILRRVTRNLMEGLVSWKSVENHLPGKTCGNCRRPGLWEMDNERGHQQIPREM